MKANQINAKFLESTDSKTALAVLDSIARHYSVSIDDARDEVTGEGAEHILEYLTEPVRSATRAVMLKNGFSF